MFDSNCIHQLQSGKHRGGKQDAGLLYIYG